MRFTPPPSSSSTTETVNNQRSVHPPLVHLPHASSRRLCGRGGARGRLGRQASLQHRRCVPQVGRGGGQAGRRAADSQVFRPDAEGHWCQEKGRGEGVGAAEDVLDGCCQSDAVFLESFTAQSDMNRSFWAAIHRLSAPTCTGTDRRSNTLVVRGTRAGLTHSPARYVVLVLSQPPAPPATDIPTLVLALDIHHTFDFTGHTFTRVIRACVLPYLAHRDFRLKARETCCAFLGGNYEGKGRGRGRRNASASPGER